MSERRSRELANSRVVARALYDCCRGQASTLAVCDKPDLPASRYVRTIGPVLAEVECSLCKRRWRVDRDEEGYAIAPYHECRGECSVCGNDVGFLVLVAGAPWCEDCAVEAMHQAEERAEEEICAG